MEVISNNQKVFQNTSIRHLKYNLENLIMRYYDKIIYIGSYLYDIGDNNYNEIGLYSQDALNYSLVSFIKNYNNRIYNNDEFTITEIYLKQYLRESNKILHLGINPNGDNYGSLIARKTDKPEINPPISFNGIPQLSDLGEKYKVKIERTFYYHYDYIKQIQLISGLYPHFYFFPTTFNLTNNIQSINVTTLITRSEISNDKVLFDEIQDAIETGSLYLIKDVSQFLYQLTLQEMYKSAKVAIMSRNLSHNIGSHVLSYLHNDLEESKCSKEEAYQQGVSHFVNYIQERQDFIAAISNDDIVTMFPANFKNDIYDFFNPEYVHKRDSSAKKCENILLHYIAYSEGFQRPLLYGEELTNNKKNIKIIFGEFDGLNDKEGENIEQAGVGVSSLDKMQQISLALPTLGRQAFFSILENIIRNAAKHDKEHIKDDLIVRMDQYDCFSEVIDPDDSGWGENLALQEIIKKYYIDKDPEDNYNYITITINNTHREVLENDNTIDSLRKKSIIPYIDENGVLNEKCKGIKEIRICATWLRGGIERLTEFFPSKEDVGKDDEPGNADALWKHDFLKEPPLLFVRLTKKGELQYIICLRKNKQLAYVTDDKEKPIDEDDKHEWKAFASDKYIRMKNNNYRYTVVANDVDFDKIRRHSGCYCYKEKDVGSPREAFKNIKQRKTFVEKLMLSSSGYDDGDTIAVVEDNPKYQPVIADTARNFITDHSKGAKYSYKAHYNPTTCKNKVLVTESITGHNSTGRLVRYPVGGALDLTWFYQHLRALKTSVIIVDERLFERVSQSKDEVLGFLDKRLYICNIEIDDNTNNAQFHYYKWEQVIENKGKDNEKKKRVRVKKENVVDLIWSQEGLKMDPLAEIEFENYKGDLISIHQGILDKMYAALRLKGDMERGRLITDLYKLLAAHPQIINNETEPEFLCNCIIHSGRAKPPKNQMPLELPFVPYSSIERSAMDCKYTLVELLSTARHV